MVQQAGRAAPVARSRMRGGRLEVLARAGYVVTGALHLLIGWLALQLAFGGGGERADQSGALSQVAAQPFGRVLLWVGVVGFLALGLWNLAEAGWHARGAADTGKAVAKGAVYLVLAWTTLGFARGGGSSSSQQSADVTARLLSAPAGALLVGALGVVVVGVGVYHVVKGARKKFLRDLEGGTVGTVGRAVVRLGTVGYVAKGVALGIVGALFVVAAARRDPSQASGIDGALRVLRDQPLGVVLLCLVALGLVAYGLYSFARARYARM